MCHLPNSILLPAKSEEILMAWLLDSKFAISECVCGWVYASLAEIHRRNALSIAYFFFWSVLKLRDGVSIRTLWTRRACFTDVSPAAFQRIIPIAEVLLLQMQGASHGRRSESVVHTHSEAPTRGQVRKKRKGKKITCHTHELTSFRIVLVGHIIHLRHVCVYPWAG